MKSSTKTSFKETEIGLIPEEWAMVKVQDVAEKIGIGPFGSSIKVDTFQDHGIPVISGQHLREVRLHDADYNFISLQHADKLRSANVFRGDVIFTHAGNIGQVSYIPDSSQYDRYIISQRQFYLRCKLERILPEFATYFFRSSMGQHLLLANRSSTGVPSITQPVTHLRGIEIPLPSIKEQEFIIHALSSLDDKIELNRQINTNLEKMASTLFKRWFVDFEFPDEKGRPYKSSGGKMVETEIGEVPEGWRVGKVNDLVRVESGFPFHSGMFDDAGSYGLVTIKNVQDGFFVSECTDRLKEFPLKMPEHCKLKPGDILLSLTGNVGRVCIVYGENYLLNQRVATLIPIEETNRAFTYALFRRDEFQNNLINISRGTAQQNLSPVETKNLDLVVPTQEVLARFGDVMNSTFKAMVNNLDEIITLATIRDSILPRLMSGRIRTKV